MSETMSLANFYRSLFGACLDHPHKQVGRCVYCERCSRRLYQGTVMTAEELGTVREVIALAAGDGES